MQGLYNVALAYFVFILKQILTTAYQLIGGSLSIN